MKKSSLTPMLRALPLAHEGKLQSGELAKICSKKEVGNGRWENAIAEA